jgi:hypothetical protein
VDLRPEGAALISFRYHLVTIVAVFLALAIGLLAGSAFVEPGLVRQLRTQTDNLRQELRNGEDLLSQVREQAAGFQAFVEATVPYLTVNRLLGERVVLIAQDGVEDAIVGETQRSLAEAGAELIAVISARDEIFSQDPETQARLAELLGSPGAPAAELPQMTAEALADRLANGADGVEPADDLLAQLLSEGFLAPIGSGLSEATLAEIGADGQVVVVLGGGPSEEPAMPAEVFAIPLVDGLLQATARTAAGESTATPSDLSFVAGVRDLGVDGAVTVDDLDLSMGGAALVLGLDRLLLTGEGGAYGLADGAEPLPPLP